MLDFGHWNEEQSLKIGIFTRNNTFMIGYFYDMGMGWYGYTHILIGILKIGYDRYRWSGQAIARRPQGRADDGWFFQETMEEFSPIAIARVSPSCLK